MGRNYKRYLVTSALPYANGPLHIGHLAGVYVPADIYVRYLRLRGRDVLWVCGSDEHGVPITIRASQEGVSPQAVVDKYHALIKRSFEEFGITFDIYHRTSSPLHYATASDFFKVLYEKGEFVEMESDQYYDAEAKQFLADRYLIGTCPHCGYEKAYGDQCEGCGTSLNGADLINPRSALSGSAPVLRKTLHWYLPLDRHEPFLRRWILEEHGEWKSNVYGQCKSWLDMGLKPRAVTRDLGWGVPVPLDGGTDGKVLYVWFDAPIGYISATKALTSEWEKYWKSPDTRMIHFIGKDNIVFHCIVFPAMLHAHGGYILPDNVPANEFLNIEGQKVSTSRNWAVWLNEYLEDLPGRQDALRYTLTANMPETKDNDFTWKDFQSRNNSELVAILGNFVNRVLVLTNKYFGGRVPPSGALASEDTEALRVIALQRGRIEEAMEEFHFRDALKEYMHLARVGNKYLAEMEPWKQIKHDEARTATVLYVSLQLVAALAGLGEPFLPFATRRLLKMLNREKIAWDAVGEHMLPEGYQVGEAELLFTKIEDDVIAAQVEKLHANAKGSAEPQAEEAEEVAPQKPTIAFEDFEKIDLRVGKILSAERVEKSNKLLKFTVDTGFDRRTVLSGIAKHFTAEEMVGRRVLMVVNLAPRRIMGVESQGMLLFAEGADGKLYGMGPSGDVNAGAQVG